MTTYTLGHHESVLRSHRWRTAENSAAYLIPHLSPGLHVLDVGCGPGTITADLARLVGADGSVLGVDRSADVIATARAESSDVGDGNVGYAVGDVMALDIPDAAYDVVHAHQVLQHLSDPITALRELRRVTRPGGLIAVREADYGGMTWHPESADLDAWLSLYRRTARHNGTELDAGRRLLLWARQAGLRDVHPSASVWCFAAAADRRWWGGLQADRILHSDIAEQAVAASLADQAALQRMAAAWHSWIEAEDGWFTVLHGEILCRVEGAEDR